MDIAARPPRLTLIAVVSALRFFHPVFFLAK